MNRSDESANTLKNEHTKEELKNFRTAVKRMFGYREEEWDAIQNPELMTKELFARCLLTSSQIQDFDIFMKLADEHPEYFNDLFAKIESRFAIPESELSEIPPEMIDAGIKRIETAVRGMETQKHN